jgi:glycosyltransferase involved in cell wall biosynthesis
MTMRVGVLTSVYALSPSDRNGSFLVEAHHHLQRAGVQLEVLAPSYEGRRSHVIDGVEVRRFRYFPKRFEHLTHMQGAPTRLRNPLYLGIAAFYVVAGLFATLRFQNRGRFDLLHVHWPFPHGIWAYAAKRIFGVPYVVTLHGAELMLSRKFPFVSWFLRHCLRNASGIVCNSKFTAAQVRALGEFPTRVIPFGCTIEARPHDAPMANAPKRILFAGRFIQRKGVPYLVRALSMIIAGRRVHLHLLGDGAERGVIEHEIDRLGLRDHVTLHGIVSNEELQRHYAAADVFVLPAIVDDRGDTEGLGVVLIEALSCGAPVVASDVGGIGDVILDGKTGLLVPQKDPAAIGAAVCRILDDPALAGRLAAAGLEHVHRYFSWARITDEVREVYQSAAPEVLRGLRLPHEHAASSRQGAEPLS